MKKNVFIFIFGFIFIRWRTISGKIVGQTSMLILMTLTSYLESWQSKRKVLTQTLISNLFFLYRKVKLMRRMTSINSQRPAFWYRLTSCIDKMHFLKHCSRQIKLRSLMDLNTKILAIQTRLATHTRLSFNWNPRS